MYSLYLSNVVLYFICHVRKSSLSDHWPQMHLLSGTLYMQDLIGQTKHLRTVHDRETSTIWALPAAGWTFSWFLHLHRERDATCSRWAWPWILLYWYRMMCGWWYMCMCWRLDISWPCGWWCWWWWWWHTLHVSMTTRWFACWGLAWCRWSQLRASEGCFFLWSQWWTFFARWWLKFFITSQKILTY